MSLDPWGQPVVVATDDIRTNGLTCLVGTFIVFRCQAFSGRPLSIFFESLLLDVQAHFSACLFLISFVWNFVVRLFSRHKEAVSSVCAWLFNAVCARKSLFWPEPKKTSLDYGNGGLVGICSLYRTSSKRLHRWPGVGLELAALGPTQSL